MMPWLRAVTTAKSARFRCRRSAPPVGLVLLGGLGLLAVLLVFALLFWA